MERDDGFFSVSSGPRLYFSEYDEWTDHTKFGRKYLPLVEELIEKARVKN